MCDRVRALVLLVLVQSVHMLDGRVAALMLLRLSLLPQRGNALCTNAVRTPPRVHILVEQPIRHLLGKKTLTLEMPPSSGGRPLGALRDAIRERCNPDVEALLEIRHGRRTVAEDGDLAEVLTKTGKLGVEPTLRLVARDLDRIPAPPTAADPLPPQRGTLRLVSFFRFAALSDEQRDHLQPSLQMLLETLNCRGSIYLAPEGVNGQLSVPATELEELRRAMAALPGLDGLELNVQHPSLGTIDADADPTPYRKLVVRKKRQILTDGLSQSSTASPALDWSRSGTELEAAEWHEMLPADGAAGEDAAPLLLDCRNGYESDAGTFEGAEALNTEVFSESWDVLRQKLDGVPKDRPIMMFCTGGIRCVKTNAFVEQELGFTRTYRLRDGIHGYLRHAMETPGLQSKWTGENFVFYEQGMGSESGAEDEPEGEE